ncbi:Serine/threonine protein kinase [Thermomonospora echinospora]|uniref:non-specific serine/threonine protein kinase n=1 Tax=Thermomonospora echinospora TaxID=1992 RepID=A0A1H6DZM5_9ACTN|nr:serine/threonine-protein kinase [Thermomonospora echinospora]SEG90792.1 Serine/threonine protein kinase [Thermomonospora echinospora]
MDDVLAGRFTLLAELGRGGMGVVWHARDDELGREVAIKQILPPHGLGQNALTARRDRMIREARAAARLNHPGAVTVHDVLRTDGELFIVMEYVPAPSLQELVARWGPLPVDKVRALGLAMLNVLEEAHRIGIVHRDVKPANVLMSAHGVKLTDFGIARLEGDSTLTAEGAVMGSPAFMSPEQVRGEQTTPATDLWALGTTLYFALEGRSPFARDHPGASMAAVLTEHPPPPRALASLIGRLLAKNPADRPSPQQIRSALTDGTGPQAPPTPAPQRQAPPMPTPPGTVPPRAQPAWDQRAWTPMTGPPRDHGGRPSRVPERLGGASLVAGSLLWFFFWLVPGPGTDLLRDRHMPTALYLITPVTCLVLGVVVLLRGETRAGAWAMGLAPWLMPAALTGVAPYFGQHDLLPYVLLTAGAFAAGLPRPHPGPAARGPAAAHVVAALAASLTAAAAMYLGSSMWSWNILLVVGSAVALGTAALIRGGQDGSFVLWGWSFSAAQVTSFFVYRNLSDGFATSLVVPMALLAAAAAISLTHGLFLRHART